MSAASHWLFGPFRLDPDNACLWRGTDAIPLKPKSCTVLHYLVASAGQLISKDTLLDACWPGTTVGDAVLKVCINELRKVLGESAQTPQYIATLPRRGYRFIAPVTRVSPPMAAAIDAPTQPADLPSLAPPSTFAPPVPASLVEREAVLRTLHTALQQARHGQRQVMFVSGEAGIGKTAVVEAFVSQGGMAEPLWVARGQCVEQYGTGEPYLPVLEALAQLCRTPNGADVIVLLRQQAPTWLVQMPWLLTPADQAQLRYELAGATRERMLREFAEFVDALTARTPLLFILEDLHWSDYATLDLVTLLARRRTPAQLILLGTYRPVEAIVHNHPLRTVAQELQRQGHSSEVPLTLLPPAAVAAYLTGRFPREQLPGELAGWLHQRTEGNPLFLVTLVNALVEQGVLVEQAEGWTVPEPLMALDIGVPAGIRALLEQQVDRLSLEQQQVLEGASVAGVAFSTAVVAAGLAMDVEQIEGRCEELAQHHLLRPMGVGTWPDSTATTRYEFIHALYQQVAYERLGAGKRLRLHQRLGRWMEAAYGARAGEIATELAEHFVRGQDVPRAVQYLRQAAENAAQRYAPREVIDLVQRALAMLGSLAATPERLQQELDLQLALGSALITTRGFAAPEVEQTYARAQALCGQLGETPQLFPTLRGLGAFYQTRGALPTARALGEQLDRLAQRTVAPTLRLEAHDALGSTLFFLGEYAAARTHLEQGVVLADSVVQHATTLRYDQVPGVRCLAILANILWCLGFPAQAAARSQQALALAQTLAHPHSLAFAQHHAAFLQHRCRDVRAVRRQSAALLPLATAQGFPLYAGFGTCWQGWALAMQGETAVGIAQLQQGMAAVLATGQMLSRSLCLVLLAEAAAYAGQKTEGLRLLAEALAAYEASGRGDMLAEVYRLQGELLLAPAGTQDTPPDNQAAEAETCFQHALTIARRQQAKSWELRAALSLSRLWQRQGKLAEAHRLLAEIYGWFTEGFDTPDVQEARALLEDLA